MVKIIWWNVVKTKVNIFGRIGYKYFLVITKYSVPQYDMDWVTDVCNVQIIVFIKYTILVSQRFRIFLDLF